jgi:hypothetical protein
MLTLRPTGLSSPAYRDLVDHIVIQDDRAVGRSIGHLNAQSPMTALPRPTFCLGAFSVAKFVRGEDHDIKSGTIEMIQAEIVKRLIAENPHLAAEDKLPELTKAVATIYDRTVVTLTNEDVPF